MSAGASLAHTTVLHASKPSLLLRPLYTAHYSLPQTAPPPYPTNSIHSRGSHWKCKLSTRSILPIFQIELESLESPDLQATWLGYIFWPHFIPIGQVESHRVCLLCSHPFLMAGTSRRGNLVSTIQKMATLTVASGQYFGKWSSCAVILESLC